MEQYQKYKKYIYILITIFITWIIVGISYSDKETELKETISSQNETISQLKEEINEKNAKIEDLNDDIERKDDEISELQAESSIDNNPSEKEQVEVKVDTTNTYILNKNTKIFHYSYCSSVNQMKDSNKREEKATREEMINKGYKPCSKCNP